eukprot:gene11472-12833_t
MTTISSHNILLAEELIETIARAFYPDDIVVLIDALLREKYIIEEEVGPRLKLSAKETRKVITQLEEEMLIKHEKVPIEDDPSSFYKCLYIDYQACVNVIRYRVYLMQQALASQESTELSEVSYKCPTCKAIYSSLEVLRMLSGDHKFICSHCCPHENFRDLPSQPFYRLIEIDNRKTINSLQNMQKKMAEQLRSISGQHKGILDLLSRLREAPLPHNLPSENIRRGYTASAIEDEEMAAEIRHNYTYSRAPGGSFLKKRSVDPLDRSQRDSKQSKVEVRLHDGTGSSSDMQHSHLADSKTRGGITHQPIASIDTGYIFEKREGALPEFLRDSRVKGADEVLRQVDSLQRERNQQTQPQHQVLLEDLSVLTTKTLLLGGEGERAEAVPVAPGDATMSSLSPSDPIGAGQSTAVEVKVEKVAEVKTEDAPVDSAQIVVKQEAEGQPEDKKDEQQGGEGANQGTGEFVEEDFDDVAWED